MVMVSQELFNEAIRLEDDGQPQQALAVWRELAISSATRNVFIRLGGCAKDLGLTDEAESAFKSALEIDDRSALALVMLGSLAMHSGHYEAAEGYLKSACAVEESASSSTLLGVALDSLGKTLEA